MSENEQERAPDGIDITRPSVARVYDYFLGGQDNFEADRKMAGMTLATTPDAGAAALANRGFLRRAVSHLARECGIRQFLDIGSGLPTRGNVHEIAQGIRPGARVVYVDHDPIVLVHGRALLAADASTTLVEIDARQPDEILGHADVRGLIDFREPVGLLLIAILHHVSDADDPWGIVRTLMDRLAPGSHLAVSHFHDPGESMPEVSGHARQAEKMFNDMVGTSRWRTREEIAAYFDGLELLAPGLVPLPEWRPEAGDRAELGVTYHTVLGGVGRKP